MQRRHYLRAVAAAGLGGLLPAIAAANTYPDKPIRMIIQFPPGSTPDTLGRLAAEHLQAKLGQPVVVDNRPGAAGNIAAEMVAKSAPDGYTLLLGQNGLAWAPWLFPKLSFDPLAFEPITLIASVPFVLTVRKDLPVRSVQELVELARSKPNQLMCGTSGIGSPQHLVAELFMNRTGTKLTTVPYKGAALILPDLISGRVDMLFSAVEGVLPHVQADRIKAIATLDPKRLTVLPQLPTMLEGGLQLESRFWVGLLAPPGTPQAITTRLADELRSIASNPQTVQKITTPGNELRLGGPAQMAADIKSDHAKWGTVIKAAGITME